MYIDKGFDRLPNELYLCIFDYLNPIEILYSFSNLSRRLNNLLKNYSRFELKSIDLTKLNPKVFEYYCLEKQINNEIESIKLTDEQLKLIKFSSKNKVRQLNLFIENEKHFYLNEQFIFENLEKLIIENNSFTWEKPFVTCLHLKQVNIHLKNHSDLIELINSLPIVEKLHVIINYDVTKFVSFLLFFCLIKLYFSCRNNSSKLINISNKLNDLSYIINSDHGLVYFVTDYSLIELLIKQLRNLVNLRIYIIGCLNTIIDSSRLENNLFSYLPKLNEFHFFIQSYGGQQIKSMDEFNQFKWNFGSYTNHLTDMHFLFTLPFQFECLDECINEYFIQGIKTTFQNDKELGLNSIKHVDLSCSITQNLLILLRDSFKCLESIRFSSSTAEYKSPPSLARQSRFFLPSIRSVIFDETCLNQSSFIRLLPNLNKLIINQKLLNILLDETGEGYVYHVTQLYVYSFQRHYLDQIINAFPNLNQLILKTILTNDEGPIRSYLDGRCHHKHRPVSVSDILDELLKSKLYKLKQIEVGCYFEKDERNIQGILSRIIRKYRGENYHFHINTEDFHSTRCGITKILFF
jgi:hypothetical protein